MATETVQKQEVDIFAGLMQDKDTKKTLGELQKKADLVSKTNEEYLKQFKQGTQTVLAGGQREQSEKDQINAAIDSNKQFVSYIGQTVDFLTNEFGQVDEYLGNMTQNFQGEEQKLIDAGKKLVERAEHPVFRYFTNKAKATEQSTKLQKQAENMRTERILRSSLAENIGQILDYYKSMKDVMYNAGIANKKSENEIATQRDLTMAKLSENEKQWTVWAEEKRTTKIKLDSIDAELIPLVGEIRTKKEEERLEILDKYNKAEQQEGIYLNIIKNARDDLKYQEQVLGNYRDVLKGIHNAIVDMEQKIDNRTVLFTNIETMVKTVYQVKSFGTADKAMNRTMAEITKASAISTEAILGELGQRAVAKPMSPDELKGWIERSKGARAGYESIMGQIRDDYSAPGH
jgi:hypothetical protein